jgi:hypothetical protein
MTPMRGGASGDAYVRFMGLVELGARRRSPLTVVGCHGMEEAHRLVATGTGRERR